MFESRSTPAATALAAVPLDSYAGLAPDEIVAECEALGRLESRVKAHQLAAARALETSKARTLGLPGNENFDEIIREYLATR